MYRFYSSLGAPITRSILSIAAGVSFLVWPEASQRLIVIILGALLLLSGVIPLIYSYFKRQNFPPEAILSFTLGVLIVMFPSFFVNFFYLFLGFLLLIASVGQLAILVQSSRKGIERKGYLYIFPLIVFIGSVLVIWNPFAAATAVTKVFGIFAIFYGVTELYSYASVRHHQELPD
ncbi:MAG: HdeD family acid-resistance protein [Bacteroidales bacterium]